jgi:hypothetical protein
LKEPLAISVEALHLGQLFALRQPAQDGGTPPCTRLSEGLGSLLGWDLIHHSAPRDRSSPGSGPSSAGPLNTSPGPGNEHAYDTTNRAL